MKTEQLDVVGDSATCNLKDYNVPENRSGCRIDGSKVGESFEMNADFASVGDCMCCEYRQYIRGRFRIRGRDGTWVTLNHLLRFGIPLSPDHFYEDGFPNGDAYGYRKFNGCSDAFLPPPRLTGFQYRGTDFPGIGGLNPGEAYDIVLHFRGEIVDTCAQNRVLQSSDWTVSCQGTFPGAG